MKLQFECKMFVTTSYKNNAFRRDSQVTLEQYKDDWVSACSHWGNRDYPLEILTTELLKANCKSGLHDGYANGDLYKVTGTIGKQGTLEDTKFKLFHCVRNDYYCVSPVLYNSIKFTK